jgi:hypothetical protein
VIGGEVYDTEAASVLHHYCVDHDDMPFAFGAVLMITLSDRHFVVDYNTTGDAESAWLRPLRIQEAVYWALLHCNKLVEEIFGHLHEAGEGPRYTPLSGPRKPIWSPKSVRRP